MQDPIQLVKDKLTIEEVVRPYVDLKKKGKYLKACCPFHQEKTPSFVISTDRQMCYCFGCNKGGDIFWFIQEIEGLDFRAALELLAERAGVELPKQSGPKISKDRKSQLKAVNKEAIKFFVQNLWETEAGKKVLAYLKGRGLSDKEIKEFEVGLAPDSRDNLYRHLLDKKHEKSVILESSLALSRDAGSERVVDRFHLRLMIPIHGTQGEPIAFGGRALKKGDQPKYLNSSEYALYHKQRVLYNLNRAKTAIREKDFSVIVEGYFDVIASHMAGVENVVATCGTALTEQQFKLLKRYSNKVALAFDGDAAGQEALRRAVLVAQPLGLEIFVVRIPEGKDAADAVKEDPALWVEAVEAQMPYLKFFLLEYERRFDLGSSQGKRDFADAFLALLKGVPHPVEQEHFMHELSKRVGTPVERLFELMESVNVKRQQRAVKEVEEKVKVSKKQRLAKYFLGLLLAYPEAFFKRLDALKVFADFEKRALALDMVQRMSLLNETSYLNFHKDFAVFLDRLLPDQEASRVYKQIRDHYNLHAVVDEAFYSGMPNEAELHQLALQAEIQVTDDAMAQEEFDKLILLLYLEFATLPQ